MSNLDFRGPFLGFTFCGVHSSELNIVRYNSGNRAEAPITPVFKDTTVDRVGRDGKYYFTTQNQQQTFNVNFAFDNVNEECLRRLRQTYNSKAVGPLVFDEMPFKQYTAKLAQQAKISYIAFDVERMKDYTKLDKQHLYGQKDSMMHNDRVYKGDGQLQFVCFEPYARAPYKYLNQYEEDMHAIYGMGYTYDFDEWLEASNILTYQKMKSLGFNMLDKFVTQSESWGNATTVTDPRVTLHEVNYVEGDSESAENITYLYNAGDINSPLNFDVIPLEDSGYASFEVQDQVLVIDLSKLTTGVTYTVNSKLKLISNSETGEVRNDAMAAGDFLFVPPYVDIYDKLEFKITGAVRAGNISYDYLYL